jgi:hypothetical protein
MRHGLRRFFFVLCCRARCCRPGKRRLGDAATPRALWLRLSGWTDTLKRLQLITGALIDAEKHVMNSAFHRGYAATLAEPISSLTEAATDYLHAGLAYSAQYRLRHMRKAKAQKRSQSDGHGNVQIEDDTAPAGCIRACTGYLDEEVPTMSDLVLLRQAFEEKLTKFWKSFSAARQKALYRVGADAIATPEAPPSDGVRFRNASAGTSRTERGSPLPARLLKELFSINSFFFFYTRLINVILSSVTSVCNVPATMNSQSAEASPALPPPHLPSRDSMHPLRPVTPVNAEHAERVRPGRIVCRCRACCSQHAKRALRWVMGQLSIRPNRESLKRALRVSIAVLVATILSYVIADDSTRYFTYWGPATVAFCSGGPRVEDSAVRTAVHRLYGTLVGVSIGFVASLAHNSIGVGAILVIAATLLQYVRLSPSLGYGATVASFTAIIIATPGPYSGASMALARIQYSLLGIAVFLASAIVVFPSSARTSVKKAFAAKLGDVEKKVKLVIDDFTSFVECETQAFRRREAAGETHVTAVEARHSLILLEKAQGGPKAPDRMGMLNAVILGLQEMLNDAQAEPNMWRTDFALLRTRYDQITNALGSFVRGLRIISQCTVSLRSQTIASYRRIIVKEEDKVAENRFASDLHFDRLQDGGHSRTEDATNYDEDLYASHPVGILVFEPCVGLLRELGTELALVMRLAAQALFAAQSRKAKSRCTGKGKPLFSPAACASGSDNLVISFGSEREMCLCFQCQEAKSTVDTAPLSGSDTVGPLIGLPDAVDNCVHVLHKFLTEFDAYLHNYMGLVAARLLDGGDKEHCSHPTVESVKNSVFPSNLDAICSTTIATCVSDMTDAATSIALNVRRLIAVMQQESVA